MLNKLKLNLTFKIVFILVGIVSAAISLYATVVYISEKNKLEIELGQRLVGIANTASALIDADKIKFIKRGYLKKDKNLSKKPVFLEQNKMLDRLKQSNGLEDDIYTFFTPKWAKGKMIFLTMSGEKIFLGHAVDKSEVVQRSFKNKKGSFSGVYTTKQGTWISAVSPIFDNKGKLIAGIGVNYNITSLIYQSKISQLRVLLIPAGLSLAIAIFLGIFLGNLLTEPIRKLSIASKKIATGMDADIPSIKSKDELGMLAKNFNEMKNQLNLKSIKLKEYTDGLEELVRARTIKLEEANSKLLENMEDLKLTQDKLVHNEKLATIGEIAAGVGHEINNPLAVIQGFVVILTKKIQDDNDLSDEKINRYKKSLDKIQLSVNRISKISDNLRKFSRSGDKEFELVRAKDLVSSTADMVDVIFKNEGIGFELSFEEDDLWINCCISEVEQVLLNLFNNAKYAMKNSKNKLIKVSAYRDDQCQVIISVKDNGEGIHSDVLPNIFDPFFTTKPTGSGTGLGLGICRDIVRGHSGELEVESEIAKGATFKIIFPIVSEKEVEDSQVIELNKIKNMNKYDSFSSGKLKVLLVDDDPGVREVVEGYLDYLDEVQYISTGEPKEALKIITEKKFDLVITDYTMPEMNGLELAKEIKGKINPAQKIILISGNLDAFGNTADFDLGEKEKYFTSVLKKPFSLSKLEKVLGLVKKTVKAS